MIFTLENLPKVWDALLSQVTNNAVSSADDIQAALKDTYEALQKYKNEKNIPREISETIYNMYVYSRLIEDDDDLAFAEFYGPISLIINLMIEGFFENNYKHDFPVFEISKNIRGTVIFDMEKDDICDIVEEINKHYVKNFDK